MCTDYNEKTGITGGEEKIQPVAAGAMRPASEQISAVESFVSRFTGPEGAKRIKRVR